MATATLRLGQVKRKLVGASPPAFHTLVKSEPGMAAKAPIGAATYMSDMPQAGCGLLRLHGIPFSGQTNFCTAVKVCVFSKTARSCLQPQCPGDYTGKTSNGRQPTAAHRATIRPASDASRRTSNALDGDLSHPEGRVRRARCDNEHREGL